MRLTFDPSSLALEPTSLNLTFVMTESPGEQSLGKGSDREKLYP